MKMNAGNGGTLAEVVPHLPEESGCAAVHGV